MFRFFAVAGLALSLSSCGLFKHFEEGYYKVKGSLEDKAFPLLVLKYAPVEGEERLTFYEKDASGTSTTDYIGTVHQLRIVSEVGNPIHFTGIVRKNGKNLHVKEFYYNESLGMTDEAEIEKEGDLVQEYDLVPCTKEEALKAIRSLVTRTGSGSGFSKYEEEGCRNMFKMSCDQVWPKSE